MIGAFYALAVLSVSQPDEVRDWEFRAGRWETVAGVLSQESGRPVRVHEGVRDEVVFGRFADKSFGEMSAEFSASTLTAWSEEGGVLVIRADGRAREARERAETQRRVEILRKSVNRVLSEQMGSDTYEKIVAEAKSLNQSVTETGRLDWEKAEGFNRYIPANRIAYAYLGHADLAELVKLEKGRRTVFASHPTSLQRPLGRLGPQLLEEFARLNTLHSQATEKIDPLSAGAIDLLYYQGVMAPEAVCIAVTRDISSLKVDVSIFARDTAQSGSVEIPVIFDQAEMEALEKEAEGDWENAMKSEKNPFQAYSERLPLHRQDKHLSKLMQRGNGHAFSDEELREMLTTFSRFLEEDLGSFVATDLLFSLSRQSGKDVSGFLPDVLVMDGSGGTADDRSIAENFAFHIMVPGQYQMTETSFRFYDLGDLTTSGVSNRRLTAWLAEASLKLGGWTVDDLASAALLARSEDEFEQSLHLFSQLKAGRSLIRSQSWVGGVTPSSYSTLLLYGLFSQGARAQAKGGSVELAYSSLSTAGKKVVADILTGGGPRSVPRIVPTSHHRLDFEKGEFITDGGDDALRERYASVEAKYGPIIEESTFALATAEASPLVLELKIYQGERLLASNGQRRGERAGALSAQMRQYVSSILATEQGVANPGMTPFQTFALYHEDLIEVEIKIGELWTSRFIASWPQGRIPEPVAMDRLPTDVRQRLSELEKHYRELYKNTEFGGRGGSRRDQTTPP